MLLRYGSIYGIMHWYEILKSRLSFTSRDGKLINWSSTLQHYLPFILKYKWLYGGILTGNFLTVAISTGAIPLIIKYIIDAAVDMPLAAETLWSLFYILLLAYFMEYILRQVGNILDIHLRDYVYIDLERYALGNILDQSTAFVEDEGVGSFQQKMGRFVRSFFILLDTITYSLFVNITRLLFVFTMLYIHVFPVFIFGLVFVALFTGLSVILRRYLIPIRRAFTKTSTKMHKQYADVIQNTLLIKWFGMRKQEEARQELFFNEYRKKSIVSAMQSLFWNPLFLSGISILFNAASVGAVIWMLIKGNATVGDIGLVTMYMELIRQSVNKLNRQYTRSLEALTDAEEAVSIFDRQRDIPDPDDPEDVRISRGDIAFTNIHFTYESGVKMFTGLNLHIQAGEKVALIGRSGSGKSTLTKLLLRLYDIQDGTITIDGQDITKVRQDHLRQRIAYVPQDSILFNRSVEENMRFTKHNASLKEIHAAVTHAEMDTTIERLPKKYRSEVGERGVKFSGGERQRLSIARAILRDAHIVVMDEATSSLDTVSEYKIKKSLQYLMENKTVIIIAHRLSTVKDADRIIVFDEGSIVEQGNHEELLEKNGIYTKLWKHQVDGFLGDGA